MKTIRIILLFLTCLSVFTLTACSNSSSVQTTISSQTPVNSVVNNTMTNEQNESEKINEAYSLVCDVDSLVLDIYIYFDPYQSLMGAYDIDLAIIQLNSYSESLSEYDSFMNSLSDSKYINIKTIWAKAYSQTKELQEYLNSIDPVEDQDNPVVTDAHSLINQYAVAFYKELSKMDS